MRIDLNSDLGESFSVYTLGNDEEMLGIISSANIACGFHGGDPLVMHRTLSLAKANGVAVGAHPSVIDQWGFGRRAIHGEAPEDIEKILIYQLGAISLMAETLGMTIGHFKLHGSLANLAEAHADLAAAVARAVRIADRDLILTVLPGNALEAAGERAGLRLAREVYADRAYDDRARLVSRKEPGAVIHDPAVAVPRACRMIEEGAITSVTGRRIKARMDTICVHGDNPAAVALSRSIRAALEAAGVAIRPMAETLA